MAFHRIRTLAACLLAVCIARHARATGGWDDEEPLTLSAALDQLPAKSFGEIFKETTPSPGNEAPDYEKEIGKIAARIGKDKPDELAAKVDALLKLARENYQDGDWSNLLYDIRDVVSASAADANAARDYIKWRLEHRAWFGFSPAQAANDNDEKPAKNEEQAAVEMRDLERKADAATGSPLKAHWLFLRGAYLFSQGDRDKCREWFEQVVKQFPDHPRAEVAAFLLARCDFRQTRGEDLKEDERKAAQKKAAQSFLAFRRKYPKSRLDADVLGWLGAIAYDTGDTGTALKYYIAQAEDPDHPEVRKSAVFMCEKTLAHMKSDEDNTAAFALIAQHPKVAMGYMYQVLNAPESDNFDGKYDPPEKVKKWRRRVLPLIAAQVAKQHDLYKSGDWQPRYLAMLAYASSEAGDQAQALQITQVAADQLDHSDDLMFARAIALQRAGRAAEAIDAYRALMKKFPKSPLRMGVWLRLALALQDNHQAGAAVVELRALDKALGDDTSHDFEAGSPSDVELDSTDSAVYPDIRGASSDQIHLLIDGLLNFAPLTELAAATTDASFDNAAKSELRAVIAERYLASENFAAAKKYMPEAQYGLIAAKLEKLTAAANSAQPGKDRAEKFAKVGDAWAAAREKLLLLPLDSPKGAGQIVGKGPGYYGPQDLLTRRDDGKALGFTEVDRELEDRDELRHASRWWMRAARENPGTPLAANARWKALDTIPQVAAQSPYAEVRAREIHINTVSREIYDKLLAECPDSVEAKRYAAYWSIPPVQKDENGNEYKPWVTHFAQGSEDDNNLDMLGYEYSDYEAFGITDTESGEANDSWNKIDERINALQGEAAQWDIPRMTGEVDKLAEDARTNHAFIEETSRVNFLDDLASFLREKSVTPAMLKIYLDLRLDVLGRTLWFDDGSLKRKTFPENVSGDDAIAAEVDEAMKNPEMKPVMDYLECTRLALVAARQISADTGIRDDKAGAGENHTYASRDYPLMEKQAREFLKKYPQSSKREAVMFVLARSVQALSRPHIFYVGIRPPGAKKPADEDADNTDDYTEEKRVFRHEPFSAKRVLEPLDAYDQAFPNGRYAADIRDYRAYVAWQTHDWPKALDLTIAQLHDGKKADLQREASLRLANIFSELADNAQRADLLAAIKARPDAAVWLKSYLDSATKNPEHPLRYLQDYLGDQIAKPAASAH